MRLFVPVLLFGCSKSQSDRADAREKDREAAPGIELPDPDSSDVPSTDPSECPGGEAKLVDGWPAYWTIIHFGAGDNDLEDQIKDDIDEMELGHGGTENVNIVSQMDYWSEDGAERFLVQPDSEEGINSEVVGWTTEEPDTGDWRTLAAFGEWAATCYPAENYMVIVGGHGGGWTGAEDASGRSGALAREARRDANEIGEDFRMIAPDDSSWGQMTVANLRDALRHIRNATEHEGDRPDLNRLVAYGSDACLMGTVEVAYELRNEARYVIGSEETEPGSGWPYSTIVRDLTSRPAYYWETPGELVEDIVTHYGRSYGDGGGERDDDETTLSAVDVRDMIKIRNRMADVAEVLIELLDEADTQGASGYDLRDHIQQSRQGAFLFDETYTDMGLFLENLRGALVDDGLVPEIGAVWTGDERWRTLRDAIDELVREPDEITGDQRGLLNDAILRVAAGPAYQGAWGLSIYFPEDECGWKMTPDDYALSDFGGDTGWHEVIRKVYLEGLEVSDYQGRGKGQAQAEINGNTESWPVYCEKVGDQLWLDDQSTDTNYAIGMFFRDGGLVAYDVVIEGPVGQAEWFAGEEGDTHEAHDVNIDLEAAQVSGELSFTADQLDGDGFPISIDFDIAFECTDFEWNRCPQ